MRLKSKFLLTAIMLFISAPLNFLFADEDYTREIRAISDLPALVKAIENSESRKLIVPVMVTPDGSRGKSDHAQGFFVDGILSLLDWRDKERVVRKLPYHIKLNTITSRERGEEEGKYFSPFLQSGGIILCERTEEFENDSANHFPRTYCIPDSWYTYIATYFISAHGPMDLEGKSENPFTISLKALALKNSSSSESISTLLVGGDRFSCGLITMTVLSDSSHGEAQSIKRIQAVLSKNPPPEIAYGVALGISAAIGERQISSVEGTALTKALSEYCSRNKIGTESVLKLYFWLDSAFKAAQE